MPRKVGYRTPRSKKLYPILEQLFLAGYNTWEAWRVVREQGHIISRQTVWKRWKEFEAKYPEALLKYGPRKKENA
jgi:hypothetical protein